MFKALILLSIITLTHSYAQDAISTELTSIIHIDKLSQNSDDDKSVKTRMFNEFGKLASIKYKAPSSPLDFKYDVFYYIPESLKGKSGANTLVFLHGGGSSTRTRSSSASVVKRYANDLIPIAEKGNFILVIPSASGINWNAHMLSYLKDLNYSLRKDLKVNPNKIGLAGHSMGAMGITRSAPWLVDEYAFFLPIAGGIEKAYGKDEYLSTYFNTTYHHMQGLKDHLTVFLKRCRLQEKNVKRLENKFNRNSGFTMEYYDGPHNYDRKLLSSRLVDLYKNAKRDIYQKDLKGVFYYRDEVLNNEWSNGNDFYLAPRNRYFWLKAIRFSKRKKVVIVSATSENNVINIKITPGVRTLRVFLSDKMVNLSKRVKVIINGKKVYNKLPKSRISKNELRKDPSFRFESYIDLKLKKSLYRRQ